MTISLKLDDNAFLRALANADEAYWNGSCKGKSAAHWNAVANRIARFCESKNIAY